MPATRMRSEVPSRSSPVKNRAEAKSIDIDSAALEYANRLIYQVCCVAGSFDLVDQFRRLQRAGECDGDIRVGRIMIDVFDREFIGDERKIGFGGDGAVVKCGV